MEIVYAALAGLLLGSALTGPAVAAYYRERLQREQSRVDHYQREYTATALYGRPNVAAKDAPAVRREQSNGS